jgi:hypothetical protein
MAWKSSLCQHMFTPAAADTAAVTGADEPQSGFPRFACRNTIRSKPGMVYHIQPRSGLCRQPMSCSLCQLEEDSIHTLQDTSSSGDRVLTSGPHLSGRLTGRQAAQMISSLSGSSCLCVNAVCQAHLQPLGQAAAGFGGSRCPTLSAGHLAAHTQVKPVKSALPAATQCISCLCW